MYKKNYENTEHQNLFSWGLNKHKKRVIYKHVLKTFAVSAFF